MIKRSLWSAYAISSPAGPLLHFIIFLCLPEKTHYKESTPVTWAVSLRFFTVVSYIACLVFGGPLIALLKRLNKLTFWRVVLPGSMLYALAVYLTLFVILGGEIIGKNKFLVIARTLLAGFGLGVVVTTLFCFLAKIEKQPYQPRIDTNIRE
jgi:hypothetical protein